jgi:hypothetical protein
MSILRVNPGRPPERVLNYLRVIHIFDGDVHMS